MAAELNILEFRDRSQWRTWLGKHHASSAGVWLVFHKEHTGATSIPYEESVREALCFGWIDSLVKRLDDDRYARKFTPRKATSKWSDLNRGRWAELNAAGLLAPAGIAAAPTDARYAAKPKIPELPHYLAKALKANPKALAFFRSLAPGYRRRFVAWVHLAKRPETRAARLRETMALLAAGKRLGLK